LTRIRYKETDAGFVTSWMIAGKRLILVEMSLNGLSASIISDSNRTIHVIKGHSKRRTMRKVKEYLREIGVVVYDEVRKVRK
jgi:hypothetical protein